jgi:hypothetical protein
LTGAAGRRTIGGANFGSDFRPESGQNYVEGTFQRLVFAGIPLALVEDFTDIGPVLQNAVDHAPAEFRLCIPKHPPSGFKSLD